MIPPCLTLSNIRYISRIKWSNPGKGVAPSPTPWCSRYWKGSLLVALNYSHQLYFTYMCFRLVGLSTPLVLMLCLKDPQMQDDTVYPEFLLMVGVVHWNKLPRYWQLKDKKNSLLTINNYLLKPSSVTIIYTIYIYMKIVSLFVVFEWQTNEVYGWCSLSMLLYFSESEAFAGEA